RERARSVDDERRTVEYQFILAANAVDVNDRQSGFLRAGRHDIASQRLLPRVVRRAVGYYDDLRAGGARDACRSRKPDVFADDDSDANTGDVDDAGIGAGLEVAL